MRTQPTNQKVLKDYELLTEVVQNNSLTRRDEKGLTFLTLTEALPQIVWIANITGQIEYYNQRWYDFTNFNPRDQSNNKWWKLALHKDDFERCSQGWKQTLKTGQEYIMEYRLKDVNNGGYRWFLVKAQPLRNQAGKIIQWFGIVTDIDDQKRAEETQRFLAEASTILSSSLDYQTTLSNVANLVVPQFADWCTIDIKKDNQIVQLAIAHSDPKKLAWGKKFHQKLPSKMTDRIGTANVLRTGKAEFYPIVSQTDLIRAGLSKEYLTLAKKIGITSAMIVPIVAQNQILGTISLISAESGHHYTKFDLSTAEELARRAGIAMDNARLYTEAQEEILERMRLEENLRNSRDQLQVILQKVADGISVQGPEGNLIYANDAAAKLMGYRSSDDILKKSGQSILDRYEMLDEFGNPFPIDQLPGRQALKGGQNSAALIRFRIRASGEEHWSVVKATPILDSQGQVLYAINVFQDITERKLIEKQKDEFLAIASHELKTPVTSIKAFTQILQQQFSRSTDDKSILYLNKMNTQLDKLTNLINDLLDVSKIQSGKLEFHKERFQIETLLNEIVEDLQSIESRHRIIRQGHTTSMVYGDMDRIGQVIINLILNAVKYSPNSDKILVKISQTKNGVQICVQDFGIGIPKEQQNRIFERFFRVGGAYKETYPGLGLGLYISSEIIKRHHGKIWVKSAERTGSSFYFSLPLK